MTGRYLILVCKNRFLVLLILISILPCLLTLAPSVSFADTFPDKRGQLTIDILSFL